MKMREFLPMGSIVRLKESKKRLMIIGRLQKRTDAEKVFDYLAIFYPIGCVDNNVVLFDEADIGELVFRGYCDIEEQEFVKFLNQSTEETPAAD